MITAGPPSLMIKLVNDKSQSEFRNHSLSLDIFFQAELQFGRGRTEILTMEWMCPLLLQYFHSTELSHIATNITLNISTDVPLDNESVSTSTTDDSEVSKYYFHMYQYICMRIILPILCVFGIIGNVLNVFILIKKVSEGIDNLEKGATLGLIALAISDFHFLPLYSRRVFCA